MIAIVSSFTRSKCKRMRLSFGRISSKKGRAFDFLVEVVVNVVVEHHAKAAGIVLESIQEKCFSYFRNLPNEIWKPVVWGTTEAAVFESFLRRRSQRPQTFDAFVFSAVATTQF